MKNINGVCTEVGNDVHWETFKKVYKILLISSKEKMLF